MTHLEFPKPTDLAKVGKSKYFEKMSKALTKKTGKKLTVQLLEKSSLLKDLNNKPLLYIGKTDTKKAPEWATLLQKEAIEAKGLAEIAADGKLALQIKVKNFKKETELTKLFAEQGIAVKFVDKLLKDGKEVSDDEREEDETEETPVTTAAAPAAPASLDPETRAKLKAQNDQIFAALKSNIEKMKKAMEKFTNQ